MLVPFRSKMSVKFRGTINLGYGIPTIEKPNAVLDYTKMIITDKDYVKTWNMVVDRGQRRIIAGNESGIRDEIITYINEYRKHIIDGIDNSLTRKSFKYSTLQYFHKEQKRS